MKRILFASWLGTLLSTLALAQTSPQVGTGELIIGLASQPPGDLTASVWAIGMTFGGVYASPPTWTYSDTYTDMSQITSSIRGGTGTLTQTDWQNSKWYIEHIISSSLGQQQTWIGFGLYKITVNGRYFYLDYLDSGYPYGHDPDIHVQYDPSNDSQPFDVYGWSGVHHYLYTGSVFSLWELNNGGSREATDFHLQGNVPLDSKSADTLYTLATVDGNATVPSSKTLTIGPAAYPPVDGPPSMGFNFASSTSLTVNGKILIEGTAGYPVLLTGSQGTWSGISISGSGANNSILSYANISQVQTYGGSAVSISGASGIVVQNCRISNCTNYGTTGLYLSGCSSPDVSYNSISSCGSAGVTFYNTNGYLYKNTLTNNGMGCSYYASPTFGKTGFNAYNGNNALRGTGSGVSTSSSSNPLMGLYGNSTCGYNSIVPTTGYRVTANGYCSPIAEVNYWGQNPVSSWFSATNNSSIDWTYYLNSDPNVQTPGVPNLVQWTGLMSAIAARASGDTLREKSILTALAQSATNSDNARAIVCEMLNLHRLTLDNSLLSMATSLQKALLPTDPTTILAIAEMQREGGLTASADTLYRSVAAMNPGSSFEKSALLNLFYMYWIANPSSDIASSTLQYVSAKYPQDADVKQAVWVYGLSGSNTSPAKAQATIFPSQGDRATSPLSFQLESNYPNPFNPSTQLRYSLPEVGKVSLVIFDVLGREIANLADATQQAGRYTVTWNATQNSGIPVSSGVYFARLRVLNDIGGVKFTKTTRLLLMK